MNRSTGFSVGFLGLLLVLTLPTRLNAQVASSSDFQETRKQVRALLRSGTAQFDAGLFDSARTQFDSVLAVDSVNPDAAYYLARMTLTEGDTSATVTSLKEAVSKAPRSFRLKRFLARIYLALNEPGKAQKLAEGVLRIRQRDSEALYLKGRALLMVGDSAQAIEVLENALTIIEARGKS